MAFHAVANQQCLLSPDLHQINCAIPHLPQVWQNPYLLALDLQAVLALRIFALLVFALLVFALLAKLQRLLAAIHYRADHLIVCQAAPLL